MEQNFANFGHPFPGSGPPFHGKTKNGSTTILLVAVILCLIVIALLVWQIGKPVEKILPEVLSASAPPKHRFDTSSKEGDRDFAQDDMESAPSNVQKAFSRKCPRINLSTVIWRYHNIKGIEWWEGICDGGKHEIEFSLAGVWLETEIEDAPEEEVPESIIQQALARVEGGTKGELEIEITPRGTFYEIEVIAPDGTEHEFYYDDQGEVAYNEYED